MAVERLLLPAGKATRQLGKDGSRVEEAHGTACKHFRDQVGGARQEWAVAAV